MFMNKSKIQNWYVCSLYHCVAFKKRCKSVRTFLCSLSIIIIGIIIKQEKVTLSSYQTSMSRVVTDCELWYRYLTV